MLYLMVGAARERDAIYEAGPAYIASDFSNALIYSDHCAVRRLSIVAERAVATLIPASFCRPERRRERVRLASARISPGNARSSGEA